MPEGWAWTRLKDIAFITKLAGFEYSKYIEPNLCENGIPLFKGKNVQNSEIIYEFEGYIPEEVSDSLLRSQINKKCILTPYVGTIGNIGIHDKAGKFHLGSNVGKIELLYSELTSEEFVVNYLKSSEGYKQLTKHMKATAQESISMEALRDVLLPLPPKEEQDNIEQKLNNIFDIIRNVEINRNDLDFYIKTAKSKILELAIHGKLVPQDPNDEPAEELLKRIATSDNRPYEKVDEEPFEIPDSWKWVKLNDLAEIARGGSPRPIQNFITNNQNGINWIKIGDTSEESKYITSAKEKIKPEGKKHSRYVHAGDFLLTNSMSFGRPYILKIDGCIHDGWLVFANIKECLLQDYLYYALSSAYIYETFSNVAAGSTVKNLKSDTVKQVDFPLPPLSEQKRIVEAIENMYEVLDQIQNNLV